MVSVFAPVNIAWIKYMGKEAGRPANPSISMTLDQLGTHTRMVPMFKSASLSFEFSQAGYVPPSTGISKVNRFLSNQDPFLSVLRDFGFDVQAITGHFEILTRNNVPAGAGIASSASGFAALTLAWFGILVQERFSEWVQLYRTSPMLRSRIAQVSALGSGSSCRSFGGPFVEWDPWRGVSDFNDSKDSYVDLILLLDEGEKAVSSSEAHERVKSSSQYGGRSLRAESRLTRLKMAMKAGLRGHIADLVWDEAMDMHDLFHTSTPAFSYWNERTRIWLDRLRNLDSPLLRNEIAITMDAGANIHVFVPVELVDSMVAVLRGFDSQLSILKAFAGKGADYHDSNQ